MFIKIKERNNHKPIISTIKHSILFRLYVHDKWQCRWGYEPTGDVLSVLNIPDSVAVALYLLKYMYNHMEYMISGSVAVSLGL